jgi:hypothetical protein
MSPKRKKLLIIAGVSALVLLVGFAIFSSLQHRGETKVNIVVAPRDSTITIDGQPAKHGTAYLKPGAHTIKASRQYFADAIEKVHTSELDNGQEIYLLPEANSPEALQWLEDHPEEMELREAIGASRAAEGAQDNLEKYPFIRDLPYKTLDYQVDYALNGDELTLIVTLYPVAVTPGTKLYEEQVEEFKQKALTYLRSQGIDLAKTKIEYKVVSEV